MNLVVSDHAVERARQRYGLVNIDADVIYRDVCEALRAGRGGRTTPDGHLIRGGGIYVWTRCLKRCYVLVPYRSQSGTHLRVITAIPGFAAADEPASYSSERRAA